MTRIGWLAAALWLSSCAPLTFSHEAAIDFDRFRAVRVSATGPMGNPSEYLAAELRSVSGFTTVTTSPTEPVDLVLEVSVTAEGNSDGSYDSVATYVAKTPAGAVVDEGEEYDTSDTELEAVEDALDEVAAHYQRPYRL